MTKQSLIEMGLTEEQAGKVMDALNGSFVTKSRFNEVNTELQTARNTIKERDTQLETLSKSTGDVQALQKQITDLQAANAEKDKTHAAEIKAIKIANAVETALTGAKAKNNTAAKALLAGFLEKAKLAEDGTVEGLDAEIKKLVEGEATAFLFDKAAEPKFKGVRPAESGDSGTGGVDPSKMSYDELCSYMAQNPGVSLE